MRRNESNDLYRVIPGVRLKRSDLHDVHEIMLPLGSKFIRIVTPSHVLDNIDELVAYSSPTEEIKIQAYGEERVAGIMFTLTPQEASVYAQTSDNETVGVASKLTDYLRARTRPGWRFRRSLLPSIVVGAGLAVTVEYMSSLQLRRWVEVVILSPMAFILGALSGLIRPFGPKTIVFAREDHERKPIDWRSASWDVFKILLGAAIAIVAGKILGYKR